MRRLVSVLGVIVAVTVATRLLMVAGAGGAFTPPPTHAPVDDSWTRIGGNPIISPDVAWEETAVFEPNVIREDVWRMWYSGGWDHPAIGYATSTDGVTWTKYASNPVYGQGGSGYANTGTSSEVIKVADTYWMFVSGGTSTTTIRTTFRVATSSDGITWTTQTSSINLPSGKTLWGNRVTWIEGATWYMLQEAGPTAWQIFLYTSTDGLTWSIANSGNPLSTLEVASGGMYGGPTFAVTNSGLQVPSIDGTYHLWYHAANVSGNLPTDVYHATSTDRITWTQTTPNPVLTHAGSGFEVEQVADPAIIVVAGTAYLFYDGVDNGTEAAEIGLATAPATY